MIKKIIGTMTTGTLLLFCNILVGNDNITIAQRVADLADECVQKYPAANLISAGEYFHESRDKSWIIVDVRSKRERNVSHIPNAISKELFEMQKTGFKENLILVYCTVGCRSGAYSEELQDDGFNAFNLYGGILAWALEGGRFITPEGKSTNRVHVYSKKWSVLPPAFESVY